MSLRRATLRARCGSPIGIATGAAAGRVIQSFAVAYDAGATLICAWCELRSDIRHFRTDSAVSDDVLDELFSIPETVIAKWLAECQDD